MKTVVITGSTRGIGYGLAESFLNLGCAAAISGRTQAAVDQAVRQLAEKHPAQNVAGWACDVNDFDQLQALWDQAAARFGRVDIWINNAGLGHKQTDFWDFTPQEIESVTHTNIAGAIYGSLVAVRGMRAQGGGSIYNMEGLGSDSKRLVPGMSIYGTTKAGLAYFDRALAAEMSGTPVLVGALRPGMVVTDILNQQAHSTPEAWERARRIFNILADRVETVTPWLARQVLENQRNGRVISWTNPAKIMWRFMSAPFTKRSVMD